MTVLSDSYSPRKIFVSPGDFRMKNHGDSAMLLTALDRLVRAFPQAQLTLTNSEGQTLGPRFGTSLTCLEIDDREAFHRGLLPVTVRNWLPSAVSQVIHSGELALSAQAPGLSRTSLGVQRRMGSEQAGNPETYSRAISECDAYFQTGCGAINDSFRGHAMSILNEVEVVIKRGRPVYFLGQGIGPIADPELLAKAKSILPKVRAIAVRESRFSVPLLERLGVPNSQIFLTGDDAIEMAFAARPAELGGAIGANLRIASYANLDESAVGCLASAVQSAAQAIGAPVVPVPISRREGEDDWKSTVKALGTDNPSGESTVVPAQAIEQAGRCRVVLTTSYHGAVFALAQGASAVCVARSDYYNQKFLGLQDEFGEGCDVIQIGETISPDRIASAITEGWRSAPARRARLLASAERQIEAGLSTFDAMVADLCGTRSLLTAPRLSAQQRSAVVSGADSGD